MLAFLGTPSTILAQKYTVSGYIKDATNGEVLIGANVFDLKSSSGTSSNTYGFYSLTLPKDSVNLVYSYVGYQPQTARLLLTQDTVISIELSESALLDEIVISASEADKI